VVFATAFSDRRTQMKHSVSLMAVGTCYLVAAWAVSAQESHTTPKEPGVIILTTFPGDSGPGPRMRRTTVARSGQTMSSISPTLTL
jgi:hypothetical protein